MQSPLGPQAGLSLSHIICHFAGELFGNVPCSMSSSYYVCVLCVILCTFVKMSVFGGRAAQRIVLPNVSQALGSVPKIARTEHHHHT